MKILFFDTETTGFYSSKVLLNHPSQQRLMQAAWSICDDDLKEVSSFNYYVKPVGSKLYQTDGWYIHKGAYDTHKISLEFCASYGVPIMNILSLFHQSIYTVDAVCAHSVKFDTKVMDLEFQRINRDSPLEKKTLLCTKELSDTYRSKYNNDPSSSKLTVMYEHFKGVDFENSHNALFDVMACKEVYTEIKQKGIS